MKRKDKLLRLDSIKRENIFKKTVFIDVNGNGYGIYDKDGNIIVSKCLNTDYENDDDCWAKQARQYCSAVENPISLVQGHAMPISLGVAHDFVQYSMLPSSTKEVIRGFNQDGGFRESTKL